MRYQLVLKSLKAEDQFIVLQEMSTREGAELARKQWRKVLGGDKKWDINRRPGLDTLDFLALSIVSNGATE